MKSSAHGEVSVVGDRTHVVSQGALCGKCSIAYNGVWRDPAARLSRPLRRRGKKGLGQFEPVSWDVALGEIADKLNGIRETCGGSSILHTHYTGTCSLIAGVFPLRFFNSIGATEVDPDTVCNKAGHRALQLMYGESTRGFDPRTIDGTQCVLVWGANPSISAPHVHEHWFAKAQVPRIVVDPIRHGSAAKAEFHLQLFPGTDGALAFAMLHAIHAAGLIDETFLTQHAIGWEDIRSQLAACTPAWGEKVTGVPAKLIEEAALVYARGPSLLWMGQGFQRQTLGGNAMRAVGLLPAATGNIGTYGSGFLYLNGWDTRGVDAAYLSGAALNQNATPAISHMDLASQLENGDTKALLTWNNNIAASSPEQFRLRRALEREDLFQVTLDLFQTDTTRYADYVLPAASFLEFDDVVMSYFNYSISAQVAAIPALGEALPNQEIFRRLSTAMGLEEPSLFESDADILTNVLEQAQPGLTFEALAKVGTVFHPASPAVQFERRDYLTPTGKIELVGQSFVDEGLPHAPFPSAEARPDHGEMRLLSPASEWLLNSSYGNDPKILKRLGGNKAMINPRDAARLGLSTGADAKLSNDMGELNLEIDTSEIVPEGVVLVYKGSWSSQQSQFNVNALNAGTKADLAESCAVHSINVTMVPASAESIPPSDLSAQKTKISA